MNEHNPYLLLLGLILLIAIPYLIIKYKIWLIKQGALQALKEHNKIKDEYKK